MQKTNNTSVRQLSRISRSEQSMFGGKAASLGEMTSQLEQLDINVPTGFAVSVDGFDRFIDGAGLRDATAELVRADEQDMEDLLGKAADLRDRIVRAEMPDTLCQEIADGYARLARESGVDQPLVAVRSSATAEDQADASFAGQYDSYLFLRGIDEVLDAARRCYASLFNDRAVNYRVENGYQQDDVKLAIVVQRMVRSDIGSSGVAFSLDTESGYPDAVLITGAFGAGEAIVQGKVDPDEFLVHKAMLEDRRPIIRRDLGRKQIKAVFGTERNGEVDFVETDERERSSFCLDDDSVLELARWVSRIESHFGHPVDVEWAVDGETGVLSIVQARPETVQSRLTRSGCLRRYQMISHGREIVTGTAIGNGIAVGQARKLDGPGDADEFEDGDILIAEITDPDWLPVMRRAGGIVTNRGGRTSHAAIVSRELGISAVTGTANGTDLINDGDTVSVSCNNGNCGAVYEGTAEFHTEDIVLSSIPESTVKVMLNLANPDAALNWWSLPSDGIGLARMEFIVSNHIKVHPLALMYFDALADEDVKAEVAALTPGYEDKSAYFVDRLAEGLGAIAAAVWPKPVTARTSDFKTNEYALLLGGGQFEPEEENPMIGWRGASRYIDDRYRDGFRLECDALRKARDELGFTNIKAMIPFCRTLNEAEAVLEIMAEQGLKQGVDGFEVLMMCEVPSNVILIDEFARLFDGFSIGSNDLTQLVLGIDRDNERLQGTFDEMDPAVQWAVRHVIERAHRAGKAVGLCGEGAGDHPRFADFLVGEGIDSISVTPQAFPDTKRNVSDAENVTRFYPAARDAS